MTPLMIMMIVIVGLLLNVIIDKEASDVIKKMWAKKAEKLPTNISEMVATFTCDLAT